MQIESIKTARIVNNTAFNSKMPARNNQGANNFKQTELPSYNKSYLSQISFRGNTIPTVSDVELDNFTRFIEPICDKYKEFITTEAPEHDLTKSAQRTYDFFKPNDSRYKLLGVGTKSVCYTIPSTDGGECAIKFLRPNEAEKFATLENEAFLLEKAAKTGIEDMSELVDFKVKNGRQYLITTLAKGNPLDPEKGELLTKERAADVIKKLTKLDKAGFIQYDAQIDNILFDGTKARMIDFGGCSLSFDSIEKFDKLKKINLPMDYGIYYPTVSILPRDAIEHFGLDEALQNSKPYLGFSNLDAPAMCRSANPYFSAFSNVADYEARSLYYHLLDIANSDLGEETSKQVLTTYLNERAEHYHKPMADLFQTMPAEDVTKRCGLPSVTNAHLRMRSAINYEQTMADMLSAPEIDEKVLKTELAKIQFRWCIGEAQESAANQYDKVVKMIDNFRISSTPENKQYYEDSLKFFEKMKGAIWMTDEEKQRPLDSSRDMLKRLFNTDSSETKPKNVAAKIEDTINKLTNNSEVRTKAARKASRKVSKIPIFAGAAAVCALAAIGGVALYKKNNVKTNTPISTPKPQNANTNTNLNQINMKSFINSIA